MLPRTIIPAAMLFTATITLAGCGAGPAPVQDDVVARASSGHDESGARGVRIYGAPVRVGNGRARSYIIRSLRDGRTSEVGVALDESALEGLAAPMALQGGNGNGHDHGMANEFLLPLPQRHGTSMQLLELNWNPAGHEPPGIYDVPHFDFHFYTISKAERDAIDPADPAFMQKASRYPAAAEVPTGYMVLPPAPAPAPAVPRMGVHWSNLAAPELQPPGSPNQRAFTHTFIYGSWDGRFTFVEPMITRAFLLTRPDITVPVSRLPGAANAGLAPTAYRIQWDAKAREYRVALSGLDAAR